MKRTLYSAVVTLKEENGSTITYLYQDFKKIRYKMKGTTVKLFCRSTTGKRSVEVITNVSSIQIKKRKK